MHSQYTSASVFDALPPSPDSPPPVVVACGAHDSSCALQGSVPSQAPAEMTAMPNTETALTRMIIHYHR